ncbi:MAG: hypothetical protein Q8P46_12490 [Hyphomicrobiales bacterium]|nr:hypothetical protein [Hyphomicrobiales bacterium]
MAIGPIGCTWFSDTEGLEAQLDTKAKAKPKADPKQKARAAATASPPPQTASSPPAAALSAAEVTSLLTGNSMYAGDGNFQFAALHQTDGALKGKTWNGETTETGTGNWRVEPNGAYCRKWENSWAGGEWGCFKVFRHGNALTMERVSGNGANGEMTLVDGNAYDL